MLYVLKLTLVPLKSTCTDSLLLCTKLVSIDWNKCLQASTWPFNNVKNWIAVSIPPTGSKISRNSLSSYNEYNSKALFLIRFAAVLSISGLISSIS